MIQIDFALFSLASATHFRAYSLQYRHVRDNILSVERSIGWRRAPGDAYGSTWDWDSDGYNGCEQSDIDDNIESSYARINEVISGIGTFPSHYTVTNIENHPSVHFTSHWCFGTKTFEIDTTGVTSFTHTGSGCCTIPFSTDTGSVAQGNFGFKATVNDVANSAPRFAARPIWVIMKGCVDQKYHVGVTDEDDVRCRWGDSSEAYNFQYDPANMQSFSLDEENCVVTYHPEFDEQGPSNKPIALQVEDFDSDGNLLHSVPLIFIVVTFEPDMDSIRGDMIPEGDKLYAGIFPDHDEEHDHSRRRRQTVTQPDYCTNSPSISVRDDLTDEQQKYFTWINLSQGPDCYPWLCAGRKRRNTDDDENPNLITITWTASYKLGNQTFYDFPRYQFSMPDGMECSAFDDKGEATCTWTPTAAQAIQRDHAHCAEVYDPYGRVSDRQCMTIILEVEACPVGYQHALSSAETAVVCADINECLSDDACGANSSCENNEGGYECICDDGYIKDDDNECIWPPMAYSDAVRTLKEWIEMTSNVLEDHNRVGKFTLRTGKLARNAFNSIQKNCKSPYNEEKYESNDFAIWDRDHDRSDDHCTQATQIKEGFQAFIDNYSCTDGKKAKQVKRVSKFIEKITNPYC